MPLSVRVCGEMGHTSIKTLSLTSVTSYDIWLCYIIVLYYMFDIFMQLMKLKKMSLIIIRYHPKNMSSTFNMIIFHQLQIH